MTVPIRAFITNHTYSGTSFLKESLRAETRNLLEESTRYSMSKQGVVYILANKHNTTLYTGVTNNLKRRVAEHKLHINEGFTDKYNVEKLVYFEICKDMATAICREKQIKKWHREWKEALIIDVNPGWNDLAESIGLDGAYLQAVKDFYEGMTSVEAKSISIGDCGSSPQ